MKYNVAVTSSRRKNRKAHFTAPSVVRHKMMSAALSKENREKYGIRSMPIRKDDEVRIVRGQHAKTEGRVTQVYRKKFVIHIDRVTKTKANQQQIPVPFHPSNVVITKLKLDKGRNAMLARKGKDGSKGKGPAAGGKDTKMADVD